eukprot:5432081-Amphidinium_carterae.1
MQEVPDNHFGKVALKRANWCRHKSKVVGNSVSGLRLKGMGVRSEDLVFLTYLLTLGSEHNYQKRSGFCGHVEDSLAIWGE